MNKCVWVKSLYKVAMDPKFSAISNLSDFMNGIILVILVDGLAEILE